ncbi:DNA helicase-2/ATP-dependent DNA helicase PcrA [Actinoalloteichus hoggarensis]|uniref:DNA 3'-5' helicase n=1 Tax=Actinoalloteichus hoggarensis TaxID=1470176 RepID=A0A221VYH4_9PSEU|nr:ATP-dependent DNA helicase [Actinoalloteichus hoggarensis]ASO18583.1 ATP-dependent DNA helicase PcrA [Actinoalloteichus hoggarensis]MBB5921951.1 DNA helicase-2/ATP-dependent DNA helicase PcrA [Actinoalloteichus hoggarensis]
MSGDRGTVTPAEVAEALGLPVPTEEQARVIAAPGEPALVIAGAGAGKTETMAARVVWLVANGLVSPERVLGLTFTRKAARQLADRVRARLRRLVGSGLLDRLDPGGGRTSAVLAGEPTVLTYHAYAGRLVAEHGLRLPAEPGARLLSETAAWQLAHRVVSTWTEDIDTDKVPSTITGYLLGLAGELAEHLVTPEQLRAHAAEFCRLVEEAPRAARQRMALPQELRDKVAVQRLRVALLPLLADYTARKRREGVLDFADQMSAAARLADEHPEVAASERARFGAVLLDEYQDTGHAQRVLLRALFGDGDRLPVTAVGDPAQAIYGWRGASAANLPRFRTDFPRLDADGEQAPARGYGLLTSFRNPPEVLTLANAVSAPLRAAGLEVEELRPKPGAEPGDVHCALLPDVRGERAWLASAVAARWRQTVAETGSPPTAAVLVRRRADMAELAEALRAEGLPVEVVGLGGLLDEPEVRDLVSALRMLVDPLAGTAAARLLTGARWRLGVADLAALWARAGSLADRGDRREPSGSPVDALPGEHAEQAGLIDALEDPGPAADYSPAGFRRIQRLARELAVLRRRLDQPLPELVADVERTLLLSVESLARPGGVGRAHLDAFADVVADFAAASPIAGLPALLDYLRVAERAEDGLEPGEVEVAEDRVQVLTMHAAKGLEWEIVAVPHVVEKVFPGGRRSADWLGSVVQLPAELRGDAADLPALRIPAGADRKVVIESLARHSEDFEQRRLLEERRLCYVALTRSERTLLVSGHWWGETGRSPRGPSDFLKQVKEVITARPEVGDVDHWAAPPEPDTENPLAATVNSAQWPKDPLGARRADVAAGAELVHARLRELLDSGPPGEDRADRRGRTAQARQTVSVDRARIEEAAGSAAPAEPAIPTVHGVPAAPGVVDPTDPALDEDDPEGWQRDVSVLLAERAAAANATDQVLLPPQLSVSRLVELAADPEGLARRLRRPLPRPPSHAARRGTAFHAWLERRFSVTRLLDVDDLPGAADDDLDELVAAPAALQDAFLRSAWADRTPHAVEVSFETEIEGVALRGRMDAVFADPDGGWTVVDWKTGSPPAADRLPALAVQLAAYRLAWAALSNTPLVQVRAAFHYVRADRTVRPADLLDAEGLRALLRKIPDASDP